MEYLVFPFGKYKGVKLEDLPSTYIVLALEKFDLPDELKNEIYNILLGRLDVFSKSLDMLLKVNKKDLRHFYIDMAETYESSNTTIS